MDFEDNKDFNEYVEKYKKLMLNDKKEIVISQFNELMSVMNGLCSTHGVTPKVLFNRELIDLRKADSSEDDFLEAMFVYVYSIKELLASIIETIEK